MSEQQDIKVFFEIHNEIPQEGPGSFESTRRAFSMLSNLPAQPRILDIGCGPGRQTLDLGSLMSGTLTAIDNHQPYLDNLNSKVIEEGLSNRITAIAGDMFDLHFEENQFDVIWAEGSIYIIGFERGLREWKPLLKQEGYIAVTELTWLRSDAPKDIRDFWHGHYPLMRDIEGNLELIRQAGYQPIGNFILPESAWWDSYYTLIEQKVATLREKYQGNDEAMKVLEAEQQEIELYRQYSAYYGYVFYVAQNSSGSGIS